MIDLAVQEQRLKNRLREYGIKIRQRMPEYGKHKVDKVIWRIQRALRKIVEGSYGVCDLCSEQIPESRLEIVPAAITCVLCQERIESDEESRTVAA